jgi:hypothetical protein
MQKAKGNLMTCIWQLCERAVVGCVYGNVISDWSLFVARAAWASTERPFTKLPKIGSWENVFLLWFSIVQSQELTDSVIYPIYTTSKVWVDCRCVSGSGGTNPGNQGLNESESFAFFDEISANLIRIRIQIWKTWFGGNLEKVLKKLAFDWHWF